MKQVVLLILLMLAGSWEAESQINDPQLGGWYIYSWNTSLHKSPFGLEGTVQDRNRKIAGDVNQLLLQAGLTYKPENAGVKFTLGYYFLGSGEFGAETDITEQNVIYEDASLYWSFMNRIFLANRLRFEQRFVENQDFRTRFRCRLLMNIPLNKSKLEPKAFYVAICDELFINGQRSIGNGGTVEFFDRNRFYAALGYCLNNHIKLAIGSMRQTTNYAGKNQLQVILSHKF